MHIPLQDGLHYTEEWHKIQRSMLRCMYPRVFRQFFFFFFLKCVNNVLPPVKKEIFWSNMQSNIVNFAQQYLFEYLE